MAATLDYYFSLFSPFSYLGHAAFLDIARKHSAIIKYKPINLMDVFKTSGALPLAQRPIPRQRYRLVELQRIAQFRDVPLTLKPAYFPTDPGLADGAVIAITHRGDDPSHYMYDAFQACWLNEQNIAEESVIGQILTENRFDADAVLATAKSDAVVAVLAANTDAAIEAGIVGAPGYVLNGEPFWGQDRIEYVDHALATGRAPFTAD